MKDRESWLRAPPCRVANHVQSKWLRGEIDSMWESRISGRLFKKG